VDRLKKRDDIKIKKIDDLKDYKISVWRNDYRHQFLRNIDSEGKVVTWNKALENLTGVAAANMVGKGNHEYALPFWGARRPTLTDLVRDWNPEYGGKYLSIQKDGNKLAIGREIKMIQLKQEINELRSQLGQSEKYEIVQ
jgi:PAS domain-containing protein